MYSVFKLRTEDEVLVVYSLPASVVGFRFGWSSPNSRVSVVDILQIYM